MYRFSSLPPLLRTTLICSLLTVGLLVVGCDSGGSGGGGDDTPLESANSVTVDLSSSSSGSSTSSSDEKASAKASGILKVTFVYQKNSGSNCTRSTTDNDVNTSGGYNKSFDPSEANGDCNSPADFDGVKAGFSPGSNSSASGLVLSIRDEEGTELASDDGADGELGASVTNSDDVTFPDDGDDGSDGGDDGDTTAPNAPANLSGSAGDGSVDLNWDTVSASDLDGYNVYRSTSSISDVSGMDPINGSPLPNTSYTDDGVNNGTTYYYVVTAVDGNGNESSASNEISRTPSTEGDGGGNGQTDRLVPVLEGNEWTVKVQNNNDLPGPITLVAVSQTRLELLDSDGNTQSIVNVSQDSDGLVVESSREEGGGNEETNVVRLKYPAEAGDSYQHTDGDGTTFTVSVSRTDVTVPAGTFENCLQYKIDGSDPITFKPGVGPVRWEFSGSDNPIYTLKSTNVTP